MSNPVIKQETATDTWPSERTSLGSRSTPCDRSLHHRRWL